MRRINCFFRHARPPASSPTPQAVTSVMVQPSSVTTSSGGATTLDSERGEGEEPVTIANDRSNVDNLPALPSVTASSSSSAAGLQSRTGSDFDFPLNRVLEDIYCVNMDKIGIPVCLRMIPILWSCILFGNIYTFTNDQAIRDHHHTSYILAMLLDLWFRFTYCMIWAINEPRPTQAKACCALNFVCGAFEFCSISAMVTYYFQNDERYLLVAKISTVAQCYIQIQTLALARRVLDIAHLAAFVVVLFFLLIPGDVVNVSPSVIYLTIITIPSALTLILNADMLMNIAMTGGCASLALFLCVGSNFLKYTHLFFVFVFAMNKDAGRDQFIYSLSRNYPLAFAFYRERALGISLGFIGMAIAHLWKRGEFPSIPRSGFERVRRESRLQEPVKIPQKVFAINNLTALPFATENVPGSLTDEMDSEPCIICFENPREIILEPCLHAIVCNDCCTKLIEKRCSPTCPLCRRSINSVLICNPDENNDRLVIVTSRRSVYSRTPLDF